ncbi:DUF6253 family protein [Streptomyces sp. NPDC003027]
MSILDATGYVAVFCSTEGDSRHVPLVCWRDDGTRVHGLVLHKGQLKSSEQLTGFMRYAERPAGDT